MTNKQLPEAPASANFVAFHKDGWRVQFTIRAEDDETVMERLVRRLDVLSEDGWTANPQDDAADLTFECASLVPIVDAEKGKTYWRVKSPPGTYFSQYGLTVWPEVLEQAGFDPDSLPVTNPTPLEGWRAEYVKNADGKPQKVTALIPPKQPTKKRAAERGGRPNGQGQPAKGKRRPTLKVAPGVNWGPKMKELLDEIGYFKSAGHLNNAAVIVLEKHGQKPVITGDNIEDVVTWLIEYAQAKAGSADEQPQF